MEWQPIETAPKGTLILYFKEEKGRNAKASMIRVEHFPVGYPRQPSHWMPIPEPPKE